MCFICSETEKYTYREYHTDKHAHNHFRINRHYDDCREDEDDNTYFIEFGKYVFGFSHWK